MRAWGSHPSLSHQRPQTHPEDHPLFLSHEGGTQHHRRRYWPPASPTLLRCLLFERMPQLFLYDLYMTAEGWERGKGEKEEEGWRQDVGDDRGAGELGRMIHWKSWKLRGTWERGEGMTWIWVRGDGNSRWLVQDDFLNRYVGLEFAKMRCLPDIILHLTKRVVTFSLFRQKVLKHSYHFWPVIEIIQRISPLKSISSHQQDSSCQ